MTRGLYLQPDILPHEQPLGALRHWVEGPKTKKGRPARQPSVSVSSLGSGDIAHVPFDHEQVPLRRNSVPLERKT